MANVLNYIFSHAQVTKKNLLVTMLIVSVFHYQSKKGLLTFSSVKKIQSLRRLSNFFSRWFLTFSFFFFFLFQTKKRPFYNKHDDKWMNTVECDLVQYSCAVLNLSLNLYDLIVFIFFLYLQDQLCGRDPTLTDELMTILTELTQLSKTTNAKVALRARQVRFPLFTLH